MKINQNKEFSLLAAGEIMLRLSPPGNERIVRGHTFEKRIGGAEVNVVSGVSLLGLRTGIISKIPLNSIGLFVKDEIRFCGVSDYYLAFDESEDARLGIYYYESGAYPRKPSVVYDRKHSSVNRISVSDFPKTIFSSTACFHTSGITLALGKQCRETTVEMICRFKEAGAVISFDVNYRANLWKGKDARKCIETILPYVDVFFCSEETARLTFGKKGTPEEMMKSFTEEYPISIVATTQRTVHSPKIHDFGSVIYKADTDEYFTEEPYRSIEVVDRLGSGDAYVSGVLYGLLSGAGCRKALAYGNASSSVKNTIPGDLPSLNLPELESIIKDHETSGPQREMSR
jgi:2-dehydro-3-deoxygluconokinase